MSDTFENINETPSAGNISSAEFMKLAVEAGEASEAKVDHSYDSLPEYEPQVVDPISPAEENAINEATTEREYNIRFNMDKILESYKIDEMADSPRQIAFINWANSKQDYVDVNFNQWVADGMETQFHFLNKDNFASAKSKAFRAGKIGDASTIGTVIHNTITTPAAPVVKEPEPLDDKTQALLDKFINIKTKHRQTNITAEESADDLFVQMEKKMRNFIIGRSQTPVTILAGAPGVGKTYTLEKVIDEMLGKGSFKELQGKSAKKIPNSEYKLVYKTAAGSGEGNFLITLFINRKNCAIVFNDCDSWLSNSSKNGTNLLKNALESKQSYIQIDKADFGNSKSLVVKYRNAELAGESDFEDFEESMNVDVEVDMTELKENSVLKYYINGNLAADEPISMEESCSILKVFGEKPNFKFMNESWARNLKETSIFDSLLDSDDDNDIDTDNSTGMDNSEPGFDPDFVDERRDDHGKVVRVKKFAFNSRVMFITNKHKEQIDSAIFDRADHLDINLTPSQYLARLASIKDRIKIGYAGVDPTIEDWARKTTYGIIEMLIILNAKGQRVDGEAIQVNPDSLSFRMYKNACAELMSLAETWIDNPAKYGCSTLDDCINNPRFDKTVYEHIQDYVAGLN